MKRKNAVPRILPREPLTHKARRAISMYVTLRLDRGKKIAVHAWTIEYTLKAERMRRAALYAYLEKAGLRWVRGQWVKRKTPVRRPAPVKVQKAAAQKPPPPEIAPEEMDAETLRQFIIDNASSIRARRT